MLRAAGYGGSFFVACPIFYFPSRFGPVGLPGRVRSRFAAQTRVAFISRTSALAVRGTGVTEYFTGRADHSALMLAARITLPHFSVSSAMSFAKSEGEPASTIPPNSASRAFIL